MCVYIYIKFKENDCLRWTDMHWRRYLMRFSSRLQSFSSFWRTLKIICLSCSRRKDRLKESDVFAMTIQRTAHRATGKLNQSNWPQTNKNYASWMQLESSVRMKDCFSSSSHPQKGHLPGRSDNNIHLLTIVAGLVILLVSALLTFSPAECLQA